MTISATDILVPVCYKIPLLYLLTQKVAQKFGYVLGIGEELTLLVDGNMAARRQMVLLAICKAHPFIFDFIRENVRESFYSLHEKISHSNFNEFFNEKKYIHPELEQITDLTIAKIRQVIFRILEQTELIESAETGILRRPYLTEQVERVITKDNARWLTIFLYSNTEMNSLVSLYS